MGKAAAGSFLKNSLFVLKKAKSQDFTNISQKLYRKIVPEKNRRKFFAAGMLEFYSHSKKRQKVTIYKRKMRIPERRRESEKC